MARTEGKEEPKAETDNSIHDVVILIHGMWSYGTWYQAVDRALRSPSLLVVAPRYGWYSIPRFISPFFMGASAQNRVKTEFANVKRHYPNARISVIAHSFGTYLFSKIMLEDQDIKVWRAVLCGSVLKQGFEWERLIHQVLGADYERGCKAVINDCGNSDWLPVIALWTGIRYGNAGTDGFGSLYVHDRFHRGGHGLFFDPSFIKTYWEPFIKDGTTVDGTANQGEGVPWYLRWVLRLRLPTLIGLLLIGSAYCWFWPSQDSSAISYATFVTDYQNVRSDPVALATLKDEYVGKRITWEVTVREVNPGERPYYKVSNSIATPRERWMMASFSLSSFDEALPVGAKVKMSGTIDKQTNKLGVILSDCEILQRID